MRQVHGADAWDNGAVDRGLRLAKRGDGGPDGRDGWGAEGGETNDLGL
jgi:hypothetical protein